MNDVNATPIARALPSITMLSHAFMRVLAACALLTGVLALMIVPARADEDPPSGDVLMCPAPAEEAEPLVSGEVEDASSLLDPSSLSLLPSASITPDATPPRSPFDDPDDGRAASSMPPSSFEPVSIPDKPYWRTNIFKRVLTDQAFLVVHWWPSEFKRVSFSAPLVTATILAARSSSDENQFDFQLERSVSNGSQGTYDETAGFFTRMGNGLPASAALGVSYLLARHYGNDRLAEASSVSFEALLSTGLWVELTKRVTARHRPTAGSNGKFFQYGQSDSSSFPSGHAAGAFTIATVFAHVYSDHKWVPWVAYGTAGLIGASRVALGRHFPSDVIAGAIIGNSIGRMALTRDGREGPLSPNNLQPIYDPKNKGFGVSYRYSW